MKSKKTICFCTCISASWLRSVLSFLALVSVPSKSSTRSLYFISRFCLVFEGAKVVVLGISSNRMQVNSELMIHSLFDTLLYVCAIGEFIFFKIKNKYTIFV